MRILTSIIMLFVISACSGNNWSYSSVKNLDKSANVIPKNPASIVITEEDIMDRPYTILGDINVTVNKLTAFHSNPTKESVNQELRKEAAGMGADAVILVRYGDAGVTLTSWGSLEGNGRAIKFNQ